MDDKKSMSNPERCPYCGRAGMVSRTRRGPLSAWRVVCPDCWLSSGLHWTRNGAVREWDGISRAIAHTLSHALPAAPSRCR